MADSTYKFDTARDLVETLDRLPIAKRKLIRKITITNPTLTLQLHASEVNHLRKRFYLEEVLSFVPGLQVELLIVDLRGVTSKSINNIDLLPCWKMLKGLLEHSNGWRELHFYPSAAMMRAWNAGINGVPVTETPKSYWHTLISKREGEGPGASVKVFAETELKANPKSTAPRPSSAFMTPKRGVRDAPKEEVKDELKDEAKEEEKDSTKEEDTEDDKDSKDLKSPSPPKKPKIDHFAALNKRKHPTPASSSNKTSLKEPEVLIIARRGADAQIESYETLAPKAAVDAIAIMLNSRPTKKVTWKKLMEAEDNLEVRLSTDPARSLKSVVEDRETAQEVMRLLAGKFGKLKVKNED